MKKTMLISIAAFIVIIIASGSQIAQPSSFHEAMDAGPTLRQVMQESQQRLVETFKAL